MGKPIKYPKNFKLAVIALLRESDSIESIKMFLRTGSTIIGELLVAGLHNKCTTVFTAVDIDRAFNHRCNRSLRLDIKKKAAEAARFARLLGWYNQILLQQHQQNIMEGAMETGEA